MASSQQCVYKSVDLVKGESFKLPSGAVLVGATNTASITTTCDTSNLETLTCYSYKFAGACDTGDSSTAWEPALSYFVGIKVADIYYPFAVPVLITNYSQHEETFNSVMNVFSNFSFDYNIDCGAGKQGWDLYETFATFPSVANNMYLVAKTITNTSTLGNGIVTTYVKVVPTVTFTTSLEYAGSQTPPACSLGTVLLP
jgi:hypothetical protein